MQRPGFPQSYMLGKVVMLIIYIYFISYLFKQHIINLWNSWPQGINEAESFHCFKKGLGTFIDDEQIHLVTEGLKPNKPLV